MSADYISSGPINKPYYFKAKVIKIGKYFSFTECEILDEKFKLIAVVSHKKAMQSNDKVMPKM